LGRLAPFKLYGSTGFFNLYSPTGTLASLDVRAQLLGFCLRRRRGLPPLLLDALLLLLLLLLGGGWRRRVLPPPPLLLRPRPPALLV
jgi:hypothetical protein